MTLERAPLSEIKAHQRTCFGHGDKLLRMAGPCPRSCKKHCKRFRFTDARSPRIVGPAKRRKYTQIPNVLLGRWFEDPEREPSAIAKLVYLHLISRTTPTVRLVGISAREMANDLGISPRAFRAHVRGLHNLDLVDYVPIRDLYEYGDSNRQVIVLRDLPEELVKLRRGY